MNYNKILFSFQVRDLYKQQIDLKGYNFWYDILSLYKCTVLIKITLDILIQRPCLSDSCPAYSGVSRALLFSPTKSRFEIDKNPATGNCQQLINTSIQYSKKLTFCSSENFTYILKHTIWNIRWITTLISFFFVFALNSNKFFKAWKYSKL